MYRPGLDPGSGQKKTVIKKFGVLEKLKYGLNIKCYYSTVIHFLGHSDIMLLILISRRCLLKYLRIKCHDVATFKWYGYMYAHTRTHTHIHVYIHTHTHTEVHIRRGRENIVEYSVSYPFSY